jgi:SAM-dependent methyltransferase
MSAFASHFISVLRQRGLLFFLIYFKESIWFDLVERTDTNARVTKDRQSLKDTAPDVADGLLYVASFTSVIRETTALVARCAGTSYAEHQFVDLGCGKGKTLIFHAKNYSSRHAPLGIEYDDHLVTIAQRNLDRVGLSNGRARVVSDSALNVLQHIEGERLVVYLYNSFRGDTLDAVLAKLAKVPHFLIYVDPAEKHKLLPLGYTMLAEHKGRYHADTWLVAQR